eukprot:jgi/Picre1/30529/NNA_005892.t1
MENKVEEENNSSSRSSLSFDGFDGSDSSSLDVDLVELVSDISSELEEESTGSDEEDAKHAEDEVDLRRGHHKPPPLQLPPILDSSKQSLDTSRGLCEEEFATARRKSVPGVSLPLSQPEPEQEPSIHDGHGQTLQYSVDLLAPAFDVSLSVHDRQRNKECSVFESLREECAEKFGIRGDRVRVYELASSSDHCGSIKRVGVEIVGSDFSVARMEEILREREETRSHGASESAKVQALEDQVKNLGEKLAHSEALRYKAQKALRELRQEVDLLEKSLLPQSR